MHGPFMSGLAQISSRGLRRIITHIQAGLPVLLNGYISKPNKGSGQRAAHFDPLIPTNPA